MKIQSKPQKTQVYDAIKQVYDAIQVSHKYVILRHASVYGYRSIHVNVVVDRGLIPGGVVNLHRWSN